MRAVVAKKQHQRVVAQLLALQHSQNLPNRVVHVRGARGPQPLARIGQMRVHLQPLFRLQHRHMDRGERHVEEKRLVAAAFQPLRPLRGRSDR